MFREHVSTIALALLFALSAFGWGDLVSKVLKRPRETFWREIVAQLVLGGSVLYLVFVGLGLFSRLHPLEVNVVVFLGVAASCLSLYGMGSLAGTTIADLKNWSIGDQLLLGFIAVLAGLQLVLGLAPLIFYDIQAYHFFAPAQFLMSGGMTPIPWNVYANSPLALQFTVGMSLAMDRSGQVAKLIFTAFACLLASGTYELILPAGRRAALLATICVLCYPEFWLMQALGVVDLAVAAFMLFGLVWSREALRRPQWHHAILAGLAFGFAMGSRYQVVILLSWVLLVVLVEAFLTQPGPHGRKSLRMVLVVGSLIALLAAPWLVRNYLHLGNPVFPLMQSVWGTGGEWSLTQSQMLSAEVLGPSILDIPVSQAILAPLVPLVRPATNGLFAAGLLLVGCFLGLRVPKSEIRIASFLALGGLLIWSLIRPAGGVPFMRFNALSLVLALAATGAVLGSEWFSRAGTRIALALSIGSFAIAAFRVQAVLPIAQSLVRDEVRVMLRRANLPSWEAFDYMNAKLDPQRHKVLVIGETRGFGLKLPAIVPSAFNGKQLADFFSGSAEPKAWREKLTHLGITHLLVCPSEIERLNTSHKYFALSPEQSEKFRRWMHELPFMFQDAQGNVVLALQEPPE